MTLIPHPLGGYTHPDDPGEPGYGDGHGRPPRVSIADDEARVLAELFAGLRVLEIGTGLGIATRAIAGTAAQVVTVDYDPWVIGHVFPALSDPPRVICYGGEGPMAFARVDAAFIDGYHSASQVRSDCYWAMECGARLIVCHDAKDPAVRRGVDWFSRERGLGVEMVDTTYGLAILRPTSLADAP